LGAFGAAGGHILPWRGRGAKIGLQSGCIQLVVNISHYEMPYRNMKFSLRAVNLLS
jgi:hypothetical protein